MKKLSYGVIGLGKFGSVVADELLAGGHTVIIADKDEEALKSIQIHQAMPISWILPIFQHLKKRVFMM
ncbi:Trk system potassium uptake protein TrkA [Campylobacter coli]|nr:Trk system potassium uptake protein TrkA [Campylobacter coli]